MLLLGPLYHLTERDDRIRALREAARVLRPRGPLFIAAISRYASLFDGLGRGFLFDPSFRAIVERDLRDGYFHHPDELRAEVELAHLEMVELLGVEGMAGWLSQLGERWENEADRELILWCARVVESEPSLLGLSAHRLRGRPAEGTGRPTTS